MRRKHVPVARARNAGFSLIELLVSMAIGLVLTVAIASVMVGAENDKRGSTSVNDVNQSGSYAAYVLDRQIRNAGSGFAQAWTAMIGCTITAQNAAASTSVLPRTAFATGSPFVNWTSTGLPFTLAPVVIGKNLADPASGNARGDLLMVMAGTGGFIEVPAQVLPGITSSNMRLNNTLGFRSGDLVLIADPAAVPGRCMVQQVGTFTAGPSSSSGSADQVLPFATSAPAAAANVGSSYYRAVIGSVNVTSFAPSTNAVVAQLGNNFNNLPQFSLIGVGNNATLYSTDLLPAGAPDDTGQAIADGVVEMHALYGTVPYPAGANPVAPTWVDPGSTGYTAASLLANTTAAQRLLHGIVAIKLGLVLRASVGEKQAVSGAALKLFDGIADSGGNSLTYTTTCGTTGPPFYRCRTVEVTIPLRNVIAAP